MKRRIYDLLNQLGLPKNMKGYRYIVKAVGLMLDDRSYNGNITKRLYPDLAREYGDTSSRVERAIRFAISKSSLLANPDVYNDVFGYTVSFDKPKPSNGLYICSVVEWLEMES